MTTLAPKLPWSHAYAGGFSRMGGQTLVSDADAQDYLNRVKAADGGVGVEVGVAQAIDAFVKGCKSDSAGYAGDPSRTNWDALKACCIMAGARTISGALVPLKGTAPTAQGGWTASDYSRGGTTPGLKGNGSTLYLDTNRAGNADGQDDMHISAYQSVASSGTVALIGSTVTSPESRTNLVISGTGYYPRVNNSVGALTVSAGGNTIGLFAASRSLPTSYVARYGTSADFQRDVTSAAHQSQNLYVFAQNTDGSPSDRINGRLAFYSIGSACNLTALDARVSTLMAAIQAFLP